MKNLDYRAVHAIPALIVGGMIWCALAIILARVDYGVLGPFSSPGIPTWFIVITAATPFFPLFFILRSINLLNIWTFSGGLAFAALGLSLLGEPAPATTALHVVMAAVSGAVAFLVLRAGARADMRGKV
jgi:hypothetical protein